MTTLHLTFQDEHGRSLGQLELSADVPLRDFSASLIQAVGFDSSQSWRFILMDQGHRQEIAAEQTLLAAGAHEGSLVQVEPTPRKLGRYELRRQLGEGGMGTVWEAFDPNLGRRVALKTIKPELAVEADSMQRFAREARAVAALGGHPNIVAVYDFITDDQRRQTSYIVMELVDGESLEKRMLRGRMSLEEIAYILRSTAAALDFAHASNLIHRDIKPGNVLLAAPRADHPFPVPKLVDFGLARATEKATNVTRTGVLIGSPPYMSPEQIQGEPLTGATDIYSLGIMAYEMITGHPPFEGVTTKILIDHMQTPPPPIRQFMDVPPGVEAAVLRALAKTPAERWARAGDFAAAFSAAVQTSTGQMSFPSGVYGSTRPPTGQVTPPPTGTLQTGAGRPGSGPVRLTQQQPGSGPVHFTPPPGSVPYPAAQPAPAKAGWWKWLLAGGLVFGLCAVITIVVMLAMSSSLDNITPTPPQQGKITPTAKMATAAPTYPRIASRTPAGQEPTPTLAPSLAPTLPPANPDALSGQEVMVGILAPLTGSMPGFGIMSRDGALMAVEEWNSSGGLLGAKIVPVVVDSRCEVDPALQAGKDLIAKGVRFIVGDICSRSTIPVVEYASSQGVLVISPSATNVSVTMDANGQVRPLAFRAAFIDSFQGSTAARFAYENLKARTAMIVYDVQNNYSSGLADTFEASFTGIGGAVVARESYATGETNFSNIIKAIAAAQPEVVFLPDYYGPVNLLLRQAREAGLTTPFIGADGWESAELDLQAADGSYYVSHYDPSHPGEADFNERFGALYKNNDGSPKIPDALAALGYDATQILLLSIQDAGSLDTAEVAAAMQNMQYQGVTGVIYFDRQHNPVKTAVIMAVRDGQVQFETAVQP